MMSAHWMLLYENTICKSIHNERKTDEEYKEKHLDKAINIPFDKIVDTLNTYGTIDFKVPIIVYCKSGGRSAQAAASLIEAGYQKVYDLGAMSSCD